MEDAEFFKTHLKCDVELELHGSDVSLLDRRVADALRKLADRIETTRFEDGFTDVTDPDGTKIGTIYVDYSEGDIETVIKSKTL